MFHETKHDIDDDSDCYDGEHGICGKNRDDERLARQGAWRHGGGGSRHSDHHRLCPADGEKAIRGAFGVQTLATIGKNFPINIFLPPDLSCCYGVLPVSSDSRIKSLICSAFFR